MVALALQGKACRRLRSNSEGYGFRQLCDIQFDGLKAAFARLQKRSSAEKVVTPLFLGGRATSDFAAEGVIGSMPKLDDISVCPGPPAARSSGRTTKEYHISLVTPLFGGGVETGTSDQTLPIRGTSIRGQLQFWWRATRGAGFADHQKLFSRHAEIWGTTDKASQVEIDVRDIEAKSLKSCAEYIGNDRVLPYVLFPFQEKLNHNKQISGKTPAQLIETASFTLRLRYPQSLETDVETAAWAWVSFGGLGARTRRGCGALLCKELAPRNCDDFRERFKASLVAGNGNVRDWPTVPLSMLVGSHPEAPVDTWKRAVELLQAFRQGKGIGRNPGSHPNRPGRSRYPEPETIRRVTGQRAPQHDRLDHVPDDAFPRAEFGLPIIFHFQGRGEPPDTALLPSNAPNGDARERMASPLILKPLALADGKAIPLILRLVTPNLAGVELRPANNLAARALGVASDADLLTIRRVEPRVQDPEFAKDKASPLVRSASGSAVEAFLDYAQTQGFHKITR